MIVYARNKVGKSRLAASAARVGKTLIIDCEEGSSSIRKTGAQVYKLKHWEEIEEIYWFLKNRKHGFKFVAIDPVTRLGQLCMKYVLGDKAAKDSGGGDPHQATQQDWGKTAELMRDVLARFKDLPDIFLILTAYERRRESEDEESAYDFIIGPDAQPAVKGFLMGQMDIIARLYVKQLDSDEEEDDEAAIKVERRLLTGPHEIYEAGDRSDNLPRIMRRPTMSKIMALINAPNERDNE